MPVVIWGQLSHPDILPTSCALPDFSLVEWGEDQKRPLLSVSTFHQSWKYFCYQSCFQHRSKTLASMQKMNSIPAKTSADDDIDGWWRFPWKYLYKFSRYNGISRDSLPQRCGRTQYEYIKLNGIKSTCHQTSSLTNGDKQLHLKLI